MPFKPGQSGNPGGRVKGLPATFREREGRKSIDFLVRVRNDDKCKRSDRIAAAKLILGYTYGQPAQSVELAGQDGGPISMTVTIQQ